MLTSIVLSPSAIGRTTTRNILVGILEGVEDGFWHHSRSVSTHCVVYSGISSSPGDGNIAARRSIVDNWDSMMSGGRVDSFFEAIVETKYAEVADIEETCIKLSAE
jgi:hypothetical protein